MRHLILILLFVGQLFSCGSDCDQTEPEYHFDIEQGIALRTITFKTPSEVDNHSTTRRSYNNRIDAGFYNIGIHSDIDLYDLTRPLGKVHNISLAYEDDETYLQTGYQINALYVTVDLGENISYYHGAIPFKGGRFSEIKDPTINGGNGLAIINNQVYSSDFVSFHNNTGLSEYSMIIGKSEFNTKNQYNGLLTKNEGSSGTYIIGKCELGKHFFEADYYDMKVKMYELEYASLQIGGIGYIYDDSLKSGFTLYTNLGMSNISEDVIGLLTQYHLNSPATRAYLASKGAVVDNTYNVKGYAGLLGANYEFDSGNQTYNVGTEVFVTRGGWVSANHGVAFLSDHSWYANRNAIESTIYAGMNYSKNLRFSTKFVNTNSKDVPNAFSISQNASQDKAFNGNTFYRHFQKIEFLVNYTF